MSTQFPFIIGVAGGSGSGKTTVVRELQQASNAKHLTVILHDNYYKDQSSLPPEERRKTNYDHPLSLETDLLIKHLHQLKDGQTIEVPVYDFTQDNRSKEVIQIKPTQIIVVEGILIFESKELREMFDLKIFVDTDADIRFIRRMKRDIRERGRTVESVVDQYQKTVKPMHEQFVEPYKKFADIIIPEGKNMAALELVIARVKLLVQG
jgi:uridine kinase